MRRNTSHNSSAMSIVSVASLCTLGVVDDAAPDAVDEASAVLLTSVFFTGVDFFAAPASTDCLRDSVRREVERVFDGVLDVPAPPLLGSLERRNF